MGQPVLSDLVTQLLDGGVFLHGNPSEAKGKQVNIPVLAMEIGPSGSSPVTETSMETSAGVPGRVIFSL